MPPTDFHKIEAAIQSRGASGSQADPSLAAGGSRGRAEYMQGNPSAPNIYHTSGNAIPRQGS